MPVAIWNPANAARLQQPLHGGGLFRIKQFAEFLKAQGHDYQSIYLVVAFRSSRMTRRRCFSDIVINSRYALTMEAAR